MTTVISCGRDRPAARSGRHDGAVSASLRYLRHVTAGSQLTACAIAAVLVSTAHPGPTVSVAAVLACAISAVLFAAGVYGSASRLPVRLLPAGAVAAVVAYTGAVAGGVALWPAVTVVTVLIAAVLTGMPWPRRPVTAVGLAVTGMCAALATPRTGGARWWEGATAIAATALCVAALMVQTWVWEIANRADRERVHAAETAVLQERLRFAAELHDIQGHSLQVIMLKSELAARLTAVDTAQAVVEMREVEALARNALRDTREVAHGYRAVSLETEIGNAVRVLAAAGVRCRTDLATVTGVSPAAERLLALVVREATTNVLRHSDAETADISLTSGADRWSLAFGNDGTRATAAGAGGGLSGLAQRFAAAGGRLSWQAAAEWFRVDAELPR